MENSDINNILEFLQSNQQLDPLSNIQSYNSEMTISQVVKFFQRHNIVFTKTMIQNYVRIDLLPPPVEKRYYKNHHLYMLLFINSLKDIYSLNEIKCFFKMALKNFEIFNETYEGSSDEVLSLYNNFISLNNQISKEMEDNILNIKEHKENAGFEDIYIILYFMVFGVISKKMSLMLQDS